MSGALLAAAAALLLWPARGPGIRRVRPAPGGLARPALPEQVSPLAAGCLAAAAGGVLSTPLVAVLAGGCAALGARSVFSARRARREEAELLALAEALGVLAAELSAGRPVVAAVRTAAAACPDGRSAALLTAALRPEAADPRAGPDGRGAELDRLRAAVRLSGSTGCPLADVLAAVEGDLRARHRRLLELRAATSGPRAAALLLAGLPVLGLAMGAGVGARPWSVLTTTPAGQLVLVSGVLLEVAGVAWVGRLLRRATADRHLAGGRDG